MGTKPQTSGGLPEQLSFGWEGRGRVGHGSGSDAVSGAAWQVVGQMSPSDERTRALKQQLTYLAVRNACRSEPPGAEQARRVV